MVASVGGAALFWWGVSGLEEGLAVKISPWIYVAAIVIGGGAALWPWIKCRRWPKIVTFAIGAAVIVAILWVPIHQTSSSEPGLQQTVISRKGGRWHIAKVPAPTIGTIADLFRSDFGGFKSNMPLKVEDKSPSPSFKSFYVDTSLIHDTGSRSAFLAVLIPRSVNTFEACIGVANSIDMVVKRHRSDHVATTLVPGDTLSYRFNDFTFSRAVYLYYESDLSTRQIADLEDLYKSKRLAVQFRGVSYLQARMLQEKKPKFQ